MAEIQESCRRVGSLDETPRIFNNAYWNTDKLRSAQSCILDALHSVDEETHEKSLKRANDLIREVIEEESA